MAKIPLNCLEDIMEEALDIQHEIEGIRPYSISFKDSMELTEDLEAKVKRMTESIRVLRAVLEEWRRMEAI